MEDPEEYRCQNAREFEFRLSEEGSRELESALAVWTTHIKALSKLVTRIKVDWQVRECVPCDVGDYPSGAGARRLRFAWHRSHALVRGADEQRCVSRAAPNRGNATGQR